jgi:hypothetical protein
MQCHVFGLPGLQSHEPNTLLFLFFSITQSVVISYNSRKQTKTNILSNKVPTVCSFDLALCTYELPQCLFPLLRAQALFLHFTIRKWRTSDHTRVC